MRLFDDCMIVFYCHKLSAIVKQHSILEFCANKEKDIFKECHILQFICWGEGRTLVLEAQQESLFSLSFIHFNHSSSGVQEI